MPAPGYILIVDDDPSIVDMVVELLTDEGYVILGTDSVAYACTLLRTVSPGLLVTDMRMPAMSGLELIRYARACGCADMPSMMMSANPHDAENVAALDNVEYIAKPFDVDELLRRVARLISQFPTLPATAAPR